LDAGLRILETLVQLLPEQTEARGLLAQALLLGTRWRPAWTQRAAPSRWLSKTAVPGTVL